MMIYMKRVFLFVSSSLLVLMTFSITFTAVTSLLGIPLNFESRIWLWYCLAGFACAFVNLFFSRELAKSFLKIKIISPSTATQEEKFLLQQVQIIARSANLKVTPALGIYQNKEVNAFSTGPIKSRALIAISSAAIKNLSKENLEGLIAHEISHISNGDMVTMTLLQGMLNSLALVVSRIISTLVCRLVGKEAHSGVHILTFYCTQMVITLMGSMLICRVSRTREFAADQKAAALIGKTKMIETLKALQPFYGLIDDDVQAFSTLKTSGHSTDTWANFLSTHPSLESRISQLD